MFFLYIQEKCVHYEHGVALLKKYFHTQGNPERLLHCSLSLRGLKAVLFQMVYMYINSLQIYPLGPAIAQDL